MPRSVMTIAKEIALDWTTVTPYALPYLQAMFTMRDVESPYYADSGKSVILYFLANAASWRGETARRIKAELKEMVK